MTFKIFSQEKDLKQAYDAAALSMQHIVDLAAKNNLQNRTSQPGC